MEEEILVFDKIGHWEETDGDVAGTKKFFRRRLLEEYVECWFEKNSDLDETLNRMQESPTIVAAIFH